MKVLHIVATGQRRGAEVFASQLVGALAGDGVGQRVVILRSEVAPSVSFAAPTTVVGSGRRPIPGVKMNAEGVRNLGRVIASFRPDVVQAHGGEPLRYALAVDRGNGARIVYRRIGDATQFRGKNLLSRRAHVGLMRRAARVVSVAEALRSELVEQFGLTASRVVTIPNGVDVARLTRPRPRAEIRAELGVDSGAQVVLSLGALTWEKDPVGHVEIVRRAAKDRPRLVHMIAGDGPLRRDVEAAVDGSGAGSAIRLLGPRDDVADLLAASDVLLLASKTEGMPACVIEAGVAGVPVVAYALSGVPEVVVDAETGLLASPDDMGGLSTRLARLLDDDALRQRLGEAAQQRCRSRFDIDTVALEYLRVYRDVVTVA